MLGSFLDDLLGQFPDDEEIVAAHARVASTSAEEAGNEALDAFLEALGKTGPAKLAAKDPSVFDGLKIEDIDFERVWKSEMHDQSRAAIFQYLGFLSTIAQTLRSIPPEIMKTIEDTAKGLAAQFGAGGNGAPDMSQLMTMFSTLGGPDGIGGLLGDLSGGGDSTPPPRPRQALPPSAPKHGKRRKH
jgi:hypothetical protein